MALTADFELGTDGNTISTGDPGSATAWDEVLIIGPATLTYDNDHPAHGGLAAKMNENGGGGNLFLSWQGAFPDQADHYGRFYIYMTTIAGGRLLRCGSGVDSGGQISITEGTGKLDLLDKDGTTQATSDTALVTNTLYRIEYHIIHSTTVGQVICRIFAGDSTVELEEFQTAANINTGTQAVRADFGIIDGTGVVWYDDISADETDWPGPASMNAGFKRLYGPTLLTGSAATLYTVPASIRTKLSYFHVSNPSASSVDLTLSIGTDATGTRIYDDYGIAADSSETLVAHHTLTAGEILQGFAGTAGVLNLTIMGWEYAA